MAQYAKVLARSEVGQRFTSGVGDDQPAETTRMTTLRLHYPAVPSP